ncbi:hypothetical protein QUB70_16880 [Microcoleus sp. A003_D6]|uniref:hypothetical protein n=1 Tax=Microcoleus sp. A003_D6 TaxID=3055266 RepID=UPI002FD4F629
MFSLSDLKHTRFYQDVFAEGKAEAKQREKAAIFRMFSLGLSTEDIATIFDLPVDEVAATIAESQKEQAEQGEQN